MAKPARRDSQNKEGKLQINMADIKTMNEYNSARRLGRRFLSEHSKYSPDNGYLPILEQKMGRKETVWEIGLGTHDVPLKKITGTYTSTRSTSFAGNFMPLLDEGTEFAQKWQNLFQHHMDKGIADPVKIYEYMGKFYVLEGNKRVSVMNYVGAYSIRADVIRMVPARTEDPENLIYFETIDYDTKGLWFVDMEFSTPGALTEIIKLAGKFSEELPELSGKAPHVWIPQCFRAFMFVYESEYTSPPLASGDAFLEYIKVYGFPYNITNRELSEKIDNCIPQFRLAAGVDSAKTIESAQARSKTEKKGGFSLFGFMSGNRKPKAVFVYKTPPEKSSWTRSHEYGRLAAEKYFDGRIQTAAVYDVNASDAYPALAELAEDGLDILFTINSNFEHASLQISLEYPDIAVFNCNHAQAGARLGTYFCKLYEQSFVLGAIAGAVTENNVLGYIDPPMRTSRSTYGINAFAQGAKLVNRNISVKRCQLNTNFSGAEDRLARAKLYEKGADVISCQYPTDDAVAPKPGDELYGMLCSIGGGGSIKEYLAAPSWNWEAVYTKILGDYLDGSLEGLKSGQGKSGSNIHFWFGLSSGAIPIYKVDLALGTHTSRLCELFENMIIKSELHPLRGPLRDTQGVLRIGKYDIPSLIDIQSMDWLCGIVDESITL